MLPDHHHHHTSSYILYYIKTVAGAPEALHLVLQKLDHYYNYSHKCPVVKTAQNGEGGVEQRVDI